MFQTSGRLDPDRINGDLAARGETLRDGDVIMRNDPCRRASQGPEVACAVPVFHDGSLFGWPVTTAHLLGLDALSPSSCGIVDAVDTYAEGLQFKAIKVCDRREKVLRLWHILPAYTRNNPVEDSESHVPLRVTRHKLRVFTFLSEAGFSIEGDGHAIKPWGLVEGADGHVAALSLASLDATLRDPPSKVPLARGKADDAVFSTGPCGGGYGDPFGRSPHAVLSDVLDGLIPPATAARILAW